MLYDLSSGTELRRFTDWGGGGRLVVFPDGESVGLLRGKDVVVRSLATGAVTRTLGRQGKVVLFDCHQDLNLLAVSTDQAEIVLWDLARPARPLRVLGGHEAEGIAVHFSPTGRLLTSHSWDGTSRLWDPLLGRELLSVRTHNHFGQLSPDERLLATSSHPWGKLRTWEVIRSGHCRTLFDPLASGAGGFMATPCDGRLVARLTRDGLRLWDAQATLPARQLLALEPSLNRGQVSLAADGTALLVAVPQGLQRWPIAKNTPTGEWTVGPPHAIGLPEWLPIRLTDFGSFRADGNATILYLPGGLAVLVCLGEIPRYVLLEDGADPGSAALSPDGRWVATAGLAADQVRILSGESGRQVHRLPLDRATVTFSSDSRFLLTSTRGEFTCWRIEDWREVWRVSREVEDDLPGSAAFAPDGSLLALSLSRTVVAFVDPRTGQEIVTLPSRGRALGFSSDSRHFLSAGNLADAIHVWDLPLLRRDLRAEGFDWEPPTLLLPFEEPPNRLRVRVVTG